MSKKRPVVIYHDNCWDGLAAAWCVRFGIKNSLPNHWATLEGVKDRSADIQFVAAKYGDEPPEIVEGSPVIIVDFSYPREVLEEINEKAGRLLVLDHHKTAQAALEGLDYCQFDMEKSGARMAWECFFPKVEAPTWLLFIEDRDLWNWYLDGTEAFTTWLHAQPMTLETLDALQVKYNWGGENQFFFEEITKGKAMMAYRDQLVSRIAERAVPVRLGDYEVYAVNSPVLQSEVGNAIAREHGTGAAVYHHEGDGGVKFSLRSKGDFDVSKIAALFGGGGHKNAAGFLLNEAQASSLFKNAIVKP